MNIGAVVEGLGERKSVASLIAKTALLFQTHAFVGGVVECGNWGALKKANGLERYGRLLLADCECDAILYLVDLDDGCPLQEFQLIEQRANNFSAQVGKPVHVVLMNREYETWFLQDLAGIKERSPEIEWVEGPEISDPLSFRDAKGTFERHLSLTYRPSIDQVKFTKKLDMEALFPESRSFKKIAKLVSGLTYHEMELLI